MVKEKMNFTSMPSLKNLTLVKITIALWNRNDIRDLVARDSFPGWIFSRFPKDWPPSLKAIDGEVIGRVSELPLPELLKKEVLGLIQPIGLEIKKWRQDHKYLSMYSPGTDLSAKELCWTPQGTVDQKKTAELLVQNESIDIATRYRLACIYCLEEDAKELWKSMPFRHKNDFYMNLFTGRPNMWKDRFPPNMLRTAGEVVKVRLDYFEGNKLIMFWTYYITGQLTKFNDLIERFPERELLTSFISPYQFQFGYSAAYGNKAATGYFLQKLTSWERDEFMIKMAEVIAKIFQLFLWRNIFYRYIPETNYAEILCFLLSQMNEEQQVKVFKKYPAGVLSCLLDWPRQTLFMEMANRVQDFLRERDYSILIRAIDTKIKDGFKDFNYHELFREFWEGIPDTCKEYVIDQDGHLLPDLFNPLSTDGTFKS